jgi:hypothetical protein
MKNNAILLGLFFISGSAFSQVGINTSNPQGIFNIDGGKDNPGTGIPTIAQQLNDVTVTSSGNIGIGTVSPTQKIDIHTGGTASTPVTGFKLADGNQSESFVLTTDANGVATWKPITVDYELIYPAGIAAYTLPANTSTPQYTGVKVSLPPGKWKIDFIVALRIPITQNYLPGAQFVRLRLADTDQNNIGINTYSSDAVRPRLASVAIPNSQNKAILTGSLGVNNQTSSDKTYYLYVDNFSSESDLDGNGTTGGEYYRKSIEVIFDAWNETSVSRMRVK